MIQAAVVGVKDKLLGEVPKAFVVADSNQMSVESIVAYCRQRLERYKVPAQIEFVNSLPRTDNGKLRRALLRRGILTNIN